MMELVAEIYNTSCPRCNYGIQLTVIPRREQTAFVEDHPYEERIISSYRCPKCNMDVSVPFAIISQGNVALDKFVQNELCTIMSQLYSLIFIAGRK